MKQRFIKCMIHLGASCENPEDNVRITIVKGVLHITAPSNLQDVTNMTPSQLVAICDKQRVFPSILNP